MGHPEDGIKDARPDNWSAVFFAALLLTAGFLSIGLKILYALYSAISFIFRGSIFPVIFISFAVLGAIAGMIFILGELFFWAIELIMFKPKSKPKPC